MIDVHVKEKCQNCFKNTNECVKLYNERKYTKFSSGVISSQKSKKRNLLKKKKVNLKWTETH